MKKMVINLAALFLVMGFLGTAFASPPDEANKLTKQGRKVFIQERYHVTLNYYNDALNISRELKKPEKIALNLTGIAQVNYSARQ